MTNGVTRGRLMALACGVFAFALAFNGGAFAAPRAAELGPEAPLAEPAGGYVGRLRVTPGHGSVGTPLHVTGEGFPAEAEFQLVWRTVKGRWRVTVAEYHGREYTPVAYRIATVKSDRDGRIAASFIAPEDFGFLHDVVVQQGHRLLTQTAFKLDMTAKLAADHGPVGTLIAIEVQGIGWRELEGSWVLLYDNKFTGFLSTVTTGGTAHFSIPATGHAGLHIVEVLGSTPWSTTTPSAAMPAPSTARAISKSSCRRRGSPAGTSSISIQESTRAKRRGRTTTAFPSSPMPTIIPARTCRASGSPSK